MEQRIWILGRLSECFTDHRDPDRIEHMVEAVIKQRVLGLCLGYEDLNDHDELCRDRLLALLCDRNDPTGEFRSVESDRGPAHGVVATLERVADRGDSGFSSVDQCRRGPVCKQTQLLLLRVRVGGQECYET